MSYGSLGAWKKWSDQRQWRRGQWEPNDCWSRNPGIVIHFRVGMSELTETLEEMDVWKNESDLCLWVKTRNWPEGELDGTFFTWGAAVFKPTTILFCT